MKFECSDTARQIFDARYAATKEDGELETPEEVFQRVALIVGSVEEEYPRSTYSALELSGLFYSLMMQKKFIPAGRTLANAGAGTSLIPNCLVLHMEDSMEGIAETMKQAAIHQQVGCGLGFPFHLLRPACHTTKRTKGSASGPISFLKAYDSFFGTIKQQNRHGANMATFSVDHPDILDFIHCKEKEGDLKNFNISVLLTDEFMEQALGQIEGTIDEDQPWYCTWKGEKYVTRRVVRDAYGTTVGTADANLSARQLLETIAYAAWRNGEPGVLFYDRLQETNPLPFKGTLEATNPCGEQALHNGANCNLGSMNLAAFWEDEEFLHEEFGQAVQMAVRFLDNVIDIMEFPSEITATVAKNERRVGLGVMGLADLLVKAGLPYGSSRARLLFQGVMETFQEAAEAASSTLAGEKGPFPDHEHVTYAPRRNAMVTNVAPSGSISLVFDVCGGIEPYFALQYKQEHVMGGKSFKFRNAALAKLEEEYGISDENRESLLRTGGIQECDYPEEVKQVFQTSMDISPAGHVKMQAIAQFYVDNSISKTVNLPESATVEEIIEVWGMAWQEGLKSVTVYRNNSRQVQVLALEEKENGHVEQGLAYDGVGPADQFNVVYTDGECPECGGAIYYSEGCASCLDCGMGMCSV